MRFTDPDLDVRLNMASHRTVLAGRVCPIDPRHRSGAVADAVGNDLDPARSIWLHISPADLGGQADELKLSPSGALPPQALVGLALKEWAGNAGTIESLSITPDLLGKLVSFVAESRP